MVDKSGRKSSGKRKSASKKKAGPKRPTGTSKAARAATKPKAKKASGRKKVKVSIKDLLLKKFDTGAKAATSLYKPAPAIADIPDAPPFVTGLDAKETKRIRALLLKKFDLKSPPAAKAEKKGTPAKRGAVAEPKKKGKPEAEAKKVKVSIKDLLLKKFDKGATAATHVYRPKTATMDIPDSPPFVAGHDAEETKRIQALLLKSFDLETKPAVKEAPEPVVKEAARTAPSRPSPSVSAEGSGPVAKAMILGLAGLAILIAFVISASFSNRDKFYLKDAHGAVQVWQGKFAPVGTELVMSLDGMKMPAPAQNVYSQEEAYRLIYNHFMGEADTLLNERGWPDFRKVNDYLRHAAAYAPTAESRMKVQARMNGLNFLVLLYKSDVALAKGTMPDLEAAREYLKKAAGYASIDYQRELIQRRRMAVERALAALAAK